MKSGDCNFILVRKNILLETMYVLLYTKIMEGRQQNWGSGSFSPLAL